MNEVITKHINRYYDAFVANTNGALPSREHVHQRLKPIISQLECVRLTEHDLGLLVGAFCEGWITRNEELH